MTFETDVNDKTIRIDVDKENLEFSIDNNKRTYSFLRLDSGRYLLRVGNKSYTIDNVISKNNQIEFTLNGQWLSVAVRDEQALLIVLDSRIF
jgi:hypothetical protein